MSRLRGLSMLAIAVVLLGGVFLCQETLAFETAPLGTYTGTLGKTTVVGGARRTGAEGKRFKQQGAAPQTERSITVTIESYSSKAELDELKAVEGSGYDYLNKLATYQHGTVQMGAKSYPINSATSSCNAAGKCGVSLVSAKPFLSPIKRGRLKNQGTKGGTGMGLVRLNLASDGTGFGSLETTMQVIISADYQMEGSGGASGRTEITNVTKK